MKRFVPVIFAALALLSLPACGSHPPAAQQRVTPLADTVFTSTRSITSLLALPDGTLWAGTTGGLLRRSAAGSWRKWTRRDGLPSEEVRRLALDGSTVVAQFPRAAARWQAGQWQAQQASEIEPRPSAAQTCAPVCWRGVRCTATLTGLRLGAGPDARKVPLPPSDGTHVSALLPRGNTLWAALYGDGLWAFDGERWTAVLPGLPVGAREITALAAGGPNVWIGTRRAGLWLHDGQGWAAASPGGDEPAGHNIESLAVYQNTLYAGTLEDGLLARGASGWKQVVAPTLSSNAPRQMIVFGGRLYVRHGDGVVDRFDGARWARNVFAFLPRGHVSALASDGRRLYAAQWGGWSEYDGKNWTHHLQLPSLQGLVITALCSDGDTLWIGTQGRGLAQADRIAGTLQWHDERSGLPDDWVTCLSRSGPRVYAGAFVGGLASWNGSRWTSPPALRGQNVTALAPDGAGGLYVATRTGGWHQTASGSLRPLAPRAPFLEPEQQALCPVPGGVWIGARTGLDFLKEPPRP